MTAINCIIDKYYNRIYRNIYNRNIEYPIFQIVLGKRNVTMEKEIK